MSSFIYSQIENQLDLKGTYLPPQKLKNIPEKMRIFLVEPVGGEPASRAIKRHREFVTKIVFTGVGVVLGLLLIYLAYRQFAGGS
jgi:hypothetical protein